MRHTLELIRTEALLSNAWARGMTILFVLTAFAAGLVIGRVSAPRGATAPSALVADNARLARPGPWGQIETIPISIECPEELLPVQAFETQPTHWILKGFTAEQLLRLLTEWQVTGDLRDEFRSPQVLHVKPEGLDLTPTSKLFLELPSKARRELYRLLAQFPENGSSLTFVLAKTLGERFAGSGVSQTTIDAFRSMSCEYGRYLVFSGFPSFLATIPTYEERVHFLKAITRQSSLLGKLRVTPDSDIDALTRYWGKASGAKDIRVLLESLARVPGGARISLVSLLPPLPSALINTFPTPENPLEGPPVKRDCHWSAFNFFRGPAEDRYANAEFIRAKLQEEYFPVPGDPRYGDLALFLTPQGALIHSAVYLADNIAYTKNGDTAMHPWMLSTVQDLIDQYSFQVPPDQALEVKFYRNKYY